MMCVTQKRIYNKLQDNIIVLTLVFLFFVILTCLYFVGTATGGATNMNDYSIKKNELSQSCQQLEKEYILLTNQIDLDYAHELGFIDVKNVEVASRRGFVALNH